MTKQISPLRQRLLDELSTRGPQRGSSACCEQSTISPLFCKLADRPWMRSAQCHRHGTSTALTGNDLVTLIIGLSWLGPRGRSLECGRSCPTVWR